MSWERYEECSERTTSDAGEIQDGRLSRHLSCRDTGSRTSHEEIGVRSELVRRKVIQPIIAMLKQGIAPERIALSMAFGVALGVFPALGVTTLLCAVAALVLRLNLPAIQLVNYVVYPLQLALLIPFMKLGGWLFGAPRIGLSAPQVVELLQRDIGNAITQLWIFTLHGVAAWLLVSPVIVLVIYMSLTPILRTVLRREPGTC